MFANPPHQSAKLQALQVQPPHGIVDENINNINILVGHKNEAVAYIRELKRLQALPEVNVDNVDIDNANDFLFSSNLALKIDDLVRVFPGAIGGNIGQAVANAIQPVQQQLQQMQQQNQQFQQQMQQQNQQFQQQMQQMQQQNQQFQQQMQQQNQQFQQQMQQQLNQNQAQLVGEISIVAAKSYNRSALRNTDSLRPVPTAQYVIPPNFPPTLLALNTLEGQPLNQLLLDYGEVQANLHNLPLEEKRNLLRRYIGIL
jgi:hypothetical protein